MIMVLRDHKFTLTSNAETAWASHRQRCHHCCRYFLQVTCELCNEQFQFSEAEVMQYV